LVPRDTAEALLGDLRLAEKERACARGFTHDRECMLVVKVLGAVKVIFGTHIGAQMGAECTTDRQ
jgi:hypothetical protein